MVQAREMQGDQSDLGARQQCRRLFALCSAHVKACATMFYYVEGFSKEKRLCLSKKKKPGVKEGRVWRCAGFLPSKCLDENLHGCLCSWVCWCWCWCGGFCETRVAQGC